MLFGGYKEKNLKFEFNFQKYSPQVKADIHLYAFPLTGCFLVNSFFTDQIRVKSKSWLWLWLAFSWQEENKALPSAVWPLQDRCPPTSKSANWGLALQPRLLAARHSFSTKIPHHPLHFSTSLLQSVTLGLPDLTYCQPSEFLWITWHDSFLDWDIRVYGGANIPSVTGFFFLSEGFG